MVFIAGPRQVGKTTLARALPGGKAGYLNWDAPDHRERILKRELPSSKLWVFDEIHKYRKWRNYLNGKYRPLGRRITSPARESASRRPLSYSGRSCNAADIVRRTQPSEYFDYCAGCLCGERPSSRFVESGSR
jgi:hypothetical protein